MATPSDDMKESVLNVLKSKGYEDCIINYVPTGGAGVNYVCSVYREKIQANKNNEKVQINAFLKSGTNSGIGPILTEMFQNEKLAYYEVLPTYKDLQQRFKVSDELNYASCLSFSSVLNNEFILLEDLVALGYKSCDRTSNLNASEMKLTLKRLARFHCLSFVLQKLEPNKFNSITNNLREILFDFNQGVSGLSEVVKVHAKAMVSMIEDEEIMSKMQGYLLALEKSDFFKDLIEDGVAKPYNVIGHGDLTRNNFMLKYDRKVPQDVILFDYQFLRNHSPVLDLMELLFFCCDEDLRNMDDCLAYLLDYYHQSFCESAAQFYEDGHELFPRKVLYEHMRKFAPLGLMKCNLILFFSCREAGDDADLMEVFKDPLKSLQMNEVSLKTLKIFNNFVLNMYKKHNMLDCLAKYND